MVHMVVMVVMHVVMVHMMQRGWLVEVVTVLTFGRVILMRVAVTVECGRFGRQRKCSRIGRRGTVWTGGSCL